MPSVNKDSFIFFPCQSIYILHFFFLFIETFTTPLFYSLCLVILLSILFRWGLKISMFMLTLTHNALFYFVFGDSLSTVSSNFAEIDL